MVNVEHIVQNPNIQLYVTMVRGNNNERFVVKTDKNTQKAGTLKTIVYRKYRNNPILHEKKRLVVESKMPCAFKVVHDKTVDYVFQQLS